MTDHERLAVLSIVSDLMDRERAMMKRLRATLRLMASIKTTTTDRQIAAMRQLISLHTDIDDLLDLQDDLLALAA